MIILWRLIRNRQHLIQYVVNATKGSQTNIRTALWALSTIIFLIVVIVEVVMNFAPIKNEAQKEKH